MRIDLMLGPSAEQGSTESNADRLVLCVILESSLAEFSANARFLVTAEGQLPVQHVVA